MYSLGIDVAKNKLDVCLLNPENDQRRAKTVPNTPEGFAELQDWLIRQKVPDLGQVHLILEATGVYHEAVALWFAAAGAVVSVVNPAQTKALGQGLAVRTKTDARDSQVLARYGALVNPPRWQPPTPAIRELNALMARLEAVVVALRALADDPLRAHLSDHPHDLALQLEGRLHPAVAETCQPTHVAHAVCRARRLLLGLPQGRDRRPDVPACRGMALRFHLAVSPGRSAPRRGA